MRFLDLNRDGLMDITGFDDSYAAEAATSQLVEEYGWATLLNMGAGDPAVPGSAWCHDPYGHLFQFHDEDGDGYEDQHGYRICEEAGWFALGPSTKARSSATSSIHRESAGTAFVDLNGDGDVDYLLADEPDDGWNFGPQWGDVSPAWYVGGLNGGTPGSRGDYTPPVAMATRYGEVSPPFYPGCYYGYCLKEIVPGTLVTDVNGDGIGDILVHPPQLYSQQYHPLGPYHGVLDPTPRSYNSRTSYADMIKEYRNGAGGKLQFDYTRTTHHFDAALEEEAALDAAAHGESANPAGGGAVVNRTTRPIVTRLTVSGPGYEAATTEFDYAYPLWCPHHRSDLGFRTIRQTNPDGSTVTRHLHQKHGVAGAVTSEIVEDQGTVVSHKQIVWEVVDQSTQPVTGSFANEEVFLGRKVRECRSSELVAGSTPASCNAYREETISYTYDDGYGYNFVDSVLTKRPTGTTLKTRIPEPPTIGPVFVAGQPQQETTSELPL